jgi:hypothetical protein
MVISSDIEALILANEADIKPCDLKIVWTISRASSYIILSKDTEPEVVAYWKDIFEKVKESGVMNTHAKKWSNKLNSNIIFDLENGFVIE